MVFKIIAFTWQPKSQSNKDVCKPGILNYYIRVNNKKLLRKRETGGKEEKDVKEEDKEDIKEEDKEDIKEEDKEDKDNKEKGWE